MSQVHTNPMKILTLSTARLLCAVICLGIIAGCSTLKCDHCAVAQLDVDGFPPLFAYGQNTNQNPGWRHIYIEGDGRPWKRGRLQNTNPTSRQKLALSLMLIDAQDSVYLERPCYGFNKAPPSPCRPHWWTSARYSQEVVTALDSALDKIQQQYGKKPLVLIGHSGGGTLAMLVAQMREDIAGIVTVAGNIDPDAWTEHHGYLPLQDSLNPSQQSPLPPSIFRWHHAGSKDLNIPLAITQLATKEDAYAEIFETNSDHNCCWLKQWPAVLEQLQSLENSVQKEAPTHQSTQ